MLHKAIAGYEDYLVSDTGQVYSLKRQKYLCVFKIRGYMAVNLYKTGKMSTKKVHRLVAEAFIPNPDDKPEVDHINRTKTDNRVENLRWADRYLQNKNKDFISYRRKRGVAIIEIVDNKQVKYDSLHSVPNIRPGVLSNHIRKGETDFTIKQRNGKIRHFILPQEK